MEFLSQNTTSPPKNLYPCLATVTITPSSTDRPHRQASVSSEDDNVLKRIASGGRRKSDTSQRRKSLTSEQIAAGITAEQLAGTGALPGTHHSTVQGSEVKDKGTWYWRVQAGVTDDALILLPLTQPPNALLTTPPAPLSEAMPAHSAKTPGQASHEEGLIDKMKNLFRRSSTTPTDAAVPHPDPATTQAGDKVIDQTSGGDQLPTAKANAMGATNVNANAESGWPGMVGGEKLQMIAVPLGAIDRSKVTHGGGKKGDGYHVIIPVTSTFAAMIAGFSDANPIKSGSIKLEFDKDWIGAKAESEILYYNLTTVLSDARSPPSPTQHQLGTGATREYIDVGGSDSNQTNSGMGDRHITRRNSQIAPGHMGEATPAPVAVARVENENASVESGRKVPGDL